VIVFDIPLLLETTDGRELDLEGIVVVYADEATRVRRLMARDGLSESDARQRVAGEVVRLPSVGGGTASHRVAGLEWPITPPLKPWARAQETARVPVEIDCSHHLQRHEIGAVTGWEVLDVCAINKTLYETLGTRTVTLECSPPGSPCGRWRRRDENW
jgi:hypothetical protein